MVQEPLLSFVRALGSVSRKPKLQRTSAQQSSCRQRLDRDICPSEEVLRAELDKKARERP